VRRPAPGAPKTPALHARIDTLRDLDRAGSPRVAYEQLQSLLETIDQTATPHALFRAQSNLASAALDLGRVEEAAASWEAAYETEPTNPHAIATLGLARLIQGRIAEARQLAEQAMSGPAPEKAGVSVLFQALARDDTWDGDPEALIPDALRSTLDADLGRVEFKRRRRDPSWREAAIEAGRRHPDEEVFRYSAAHAVLDMASPFHDPAHPIDQRVHRPDLEAAAKLLAERVDAWLRDDYQDLYELEAYANNAAVAYRLLGEFDQARALIDRTLAVHPGMLGPRKLQGVIEAMDGDKRRAIELLSLVPQDGEAQLYRAELISQDQPQEALTALFAIPDEIVPVEHKTTRWLIAGSVALRLRDRASLDRAVAQITLDPPRALFADVFEIEWDARHGLDQAEVQRRLLGVAGRLDDNTTLSIRASLADLLCRHQLYFEASECLEGYVGFSQPDEVTLLYLRALASSRRDKRFLAAISQASDLVRNDPAVIRIIALHAYNAGELATAEVEARKLVKAQDGELEPVLLLLDVLARRDERRAIAKVLSRDLEGLETGGLDERLKLARYLFVFGDRDRALRYSYWLSWRYRDDRRALMAQCFQTLEATRVGAQTSYDVRIAADDVCVEIRTDDETIRFVIEPDARLRQLSDRAWEPSHPLAQAALGKAVDDQVELPDGETGQIVSITHKFIARMQEAFQTLHRRFPNNPGFQKFKVDPDAPGGFDKVYETAKAQTATVDAALEDYKAGRALVSMLAMQLGSSALDVVEGMKFGGPKLVNAAGSIAERQAAGDALTVSLGKGFVIDTATFWCLWRLQAVDAVVQVLGKMHVSSTIFDELATRRDFLEPHAQEGLQQFGYRDGRPTLTEISAKAIRNGIALVEGAVAWLKANASVCPAHTPETLPDNVARTVGQMRFHFLDELFIALNEDLLLLSDDLWLRDDGKRTGRCSRGLDTVDFGLCGRAGRGDLGPVHRLVRPAGGDGAYLHRRHPRPAAACPATR
jgi:tetratricopeptide (TPR) repeat protein